MTRHGIMMVAFALIGGFLNYLYQLTMGWLLSPEDYGTLISLLSLLVIVTVISMTIDTTVTKFASKESTNNRLGRLNYLWRLFLKRTCLLGLAVFIVLALLTPVISGFLNITNNWYLFILSFSFVLMFSVQVNLGTLRGLQRFLPLGVSSTLGALLKITIAVGLVHVGLSVYGALLSFPIATVIVFFVSIYFLRDLSTAGSEKVEVRNIHSYSVSAFLALFTLTVMTNVDVIFAKHYLSAVDAGKYSAISVMGKLAFFAPNVIAVVMFPKTSQLFEVEGDYRSILRKATLLTLLLAGGVVIIYWLFPQFIVNTLFLGKYATAIPYLFKYGLAMAFFAVSNLLMFYFLSLNRTKMTYFLIGATLLEFCLITLFHSSIAQLVNMMLISGAACLVLMLVFYLAVRNNLGHNVSP